MQVPVGGGPYALAAGPDGALWVTLVHGDQVARVAMDGQVETFAVGSKPSIITAGGDGALWFTCSGDDTIGRITTGGELTSFALPAAARRSGSRPALTARCGSPRWARDRVGRITLDGRDHRVRAARRVDAVDDRDRA